MFHTPRNPSHRVRQDNPRRIHAAALRRPSGTDSQGSLRVAFWLYDGGVQARLRFQGRNLSLVNDTRETRLFVALLGRLSVDNFLTYAEAGEAIFTRPDDASANALIRQAKCRLNHLLLERLGPLFAVAPTAPGRDADWVLCRRGHGYLLNPAARFVSQTDESWDPRCSPGLAGDVGEMAIDHT